ncbi:MAG: hypothetical protein KDD94_12865, partial [Calditrichaeota bacterium]|nr:hypothetical protein [Calditrichota bacterium]
YNQPSFRSDIKLKQELLKPLVGEYQYGDDFFFPGVTKNLFILDGILYGQGRTTTALIPQSNNEFLDRMNWAIITFNKDNSGKVIGYDWKYDGRIWKTKKISN